MPRDRFLVLFSFAVLAVITAGYLALGPRPVQTPKAGESVSPSPQPSTAFAKPKWFPIEDCAAGVEMKKQTPEALAFLTTQCCNMFDHGPDYWSRETCAAGILPSGSFVYGRGCYDAADGVCRWAFTADLEADYTMYLDAPKSIGYYLASKTLYRADFAARQWKVLGKLDEARFQEDVPESVRTDLSEWKLLLVRENTAYFTHTAKIEDDYFLIVLKLDQATNAFAMVDKIGDYPEQNLEPTLPPKPEEDRGMVRPDQADPVAPDSSLYRMGNVRLHGQDPYFLLIRDLERPGVDLFVGRAEFCALRPSDKHLFISYEIDERQIVEFAPGKDGYSEVRRFRSSGIPLAMSFDGNAAYLWQRFGKHKFCDVFGLPTMEFRRSTNSGPFWPVGATSGRQQVVADSRIVNVLDCESGKPKFPRRMGWSGDPWFSLAWGTTICCWIDQNSVTVWDFAAGKVQSIELPEYVDAARVSYVQGLPGFALSPSEGAARWFIRLLPGQSPMLIFAPLGYSDEPAGLHYPYLSSACFEKRPYFWPGTDKETSSDGVYFAGRIFSLSDGVVEVCDAANNPTPFTTPEPVKEFSPVTESVILADKGLVDLEGKVLPVGICYTMPEALIYADPVHSKWVRLGHDGSFAQITMSDDASFIADLAGTGNCVICWEWEDLLLCKWQPREPDETDRKIAGFLGWGK
ncbi:MAG: hypothetical protein WC712_10960 [Candidatus Brocadiia bacterium]